MTHSKTIATKKIFDLRSGIAEGRVVFLKMKYFLVITDHLT
jgi:hypothetical protein